ncbi:unnamed protein product [Lymnaea stagnalis]|uniref:Active breakpoint cluster region-related protein n=1 Tax=Lymnaea stagnalis TaxID=6523 RepID=A0AAV2IHZ7_LYMST
MKSAKVCRMREVFLDEWRRDHPTVPTPVMMSIRDIGHESNDDDEWKAPGHVMAVRADIQAAEERIIRLHEEIQNEIRLKQFLGEVLSVLDGSDNNSSWIGLSAVKTGAYLGPDKLARSPQCDVDFRGRSSGSINNSSTGRLGVGDISPGSKSRIDCECVDGLLESCCVCVTGVRDCARKSKTVRDDVVTVRESSERNFWSLQRRDNEKTGSYGFDVEADKCFHAFGRSNSEPDQEMFRKGKTSFGSKPGEGEVGHYKNSSKDNFMAVKSKHSPSSEVPLHHDPVTNSPRLNRNYQLLKMTPGYEFVLDSGHEKSNSNNNNTAGRVENVDMRHGPKWIDGTRGVGEGKNRNSDDSAGSVTSSSPTRVYGSLPIADNTSTINIRRSGGDDAGPLDHGQDHYKNDKSPRESHSSPPAVTLRTESPHQTYNQQPQQHSPGETKRSDPGQRDSTELTTDNVGSPRSSVKKSPVPPPVAKKPPRPGSVIQSPPTFTWIRQSGDPTAQHSNVGPDISDSSDKSRLGQESGAEVPAWDSPGSADSHHFGAQISPQRNSGSGDRPPLLPPSAPLLAELKSKCVERQNSLPTVFLEGSECFDQGEMNSAGVVLRSLGKCNDIPSRPKSADILETRSQHLMKTNVDKAYRGSVERLAESVGSNLVFVHTRLGEQQQQQQQQQEQQHSYASSPKKDESPKPARQRAPDPPSPPPRVEQLEIKTNATASTDGDFPKHTRLSSSASNDTITEFNRNDSFTSDADIKDAFNTLATILREDEMMESQQPPPALNPKRRKAPIYENWTINRAVTASITQQDFDSVSDDDELDGPSVASASASPSLKRHGSPTGSKDSGLCEEGMFDNAHGDAVFEHDLASGRVHDLRTLQQMEQCEEEGSDCFDSIEEPVRELDYTDAVSAASDFVYTPSARDSQLSTDGHFRGPSPRPDYDGTKHEDVDRTSWMTNSSGEEELGTPMDSSYDETDSARDGMLKMRQLLVKGVLDSEKEYLEMLSVLIHYKRNLEATSLSSQPVISQEDINKIFSNIQTIFDIHNDFVTSLQPKVNAWTHDKTIGEYFKEMIFKFHQCGSYLSNYQVAVSTIHKCCAESDTFQQLAKEIKISPTLKQTTTLEDALFKPVQRVQRNTLVLHDLLKYTPEDHPDHRALQKALKLSQLILENFATNIPTKHTTSENRRLVKSSFLVELVSGTRKLRFMFLFSDVLVCTKRETHRNNKVTFDIKWFTTLNQMSIDTKFGYNDDLKASTKDDIEELKGKLRLLKKELRMEMKKFDDKDKHRSIVGLGGATRVVEKLRKKINQYEAQLILACPKLPFKVSLEGGKTYTLLMTTDYEREEWKETIASLSTRTGERQTPMSSITVQELINSVKETPQVNKIGNVLMQKDEDILTGTLNVTIHKLNGLTQDCDTYCCLEMDSFGHFFMKAKTHIITATRDPAWNEDFELELESSQTLRFLCFKKEQDEHGDTLLGRGAFELSRHWLKQSFQEKTVAMNEISLVISVRHTAAEKTMSRTPSRTTSAVFGVKISSCARREGKTVPSIVTACLQEVERRGLDEVGIYRVSGVTSDLQRIKKMFDKNIRAGMACLLDVDIHAVTGVLKLYLRELPDPLFTEANYQNFVDTLKLSDEEAKAQCMLSLLHGLPDTNYYTIVYLLEHLLKVARNVTVNKMSVHNLATVFGPTLLAPASKHSSDDPIEMMCKGAEQVMLQSSVVNYLLGLAVSGRNLRRSAQK